MDELNQKFIQLDTLNKQIVELEQKVKSKKYKKKIKDILNNRNINEAIVMHKEMPDNIDITNLILQTVENCISKKQHIALREILNLLDHSILYNKCKDMVFCLICKEFDIKNCNMEQFLNCYKTVKLFYKDIFMDELKVYANNNFDKFISTSEGTLELDKKIQMLLECMNYGLFTDKSEVYVILESQYVKNVIKQRYLQTKDDIIFFRKRIMDRVKSMKNKNIEEKMESIFDEL